MKGLLIAMALMTGLTVSADKPAPTTTSGSIYYAPASVEIGGVDERGKYYLIVEGKRVPCSRKQLIKRVWDSNMEPRDKFQSLRYLGVPVGISLYERDGKR
jgi:hypothetical protein